jgi:adenylylsulfate reductase subunit A
LEKAEKEIDKLLELWSDLSVADLDELLSAYEVRERLIVSKVLIAHLKARRETRWHGFQENANYPEKDKNFECYIKSVYENGQVQVFKRELIKL